MRKLKYVKLFEKYTKEDFTEEKLKPLTMNLLYEPTDESRKKVDDFFKEFLKELNLQITLKEIKTRVCETNSALEFSKDKDQFYKTLYKAGQSSLSMAQSLKEFFEEEDIFKNNN